MISTVVVVVIVPVIPDHVVWSRAFLARDLRIFGTYCRYNNKGDISDEFEGRVIFVC